MTLLLLAYVGAGTTLLAISIFGLVCWRRRHGSSPDGSSVSAPGPPNSRIPGPLTAAPSVGLEPEVSPPDRICVEPQDLPAEMTDTPIPLPPADTLADRLRPASVAKQEPSARGGLTLVAIRLDGLDEVNQRFGPDTGERALLEVARAVRRALRDKDACARWEGDRFLAVLPRTDRLGASLVMARVHRAVSSLRMVTSSGVEVRLETTIGSASAPNDGISLDDLLGALRRELDRADARRSTPAEDLAPAERIRRAIPLISN